MDISFLAEDNFGLTYISCIEIDGNPILAPVMTEVKRTEMRKYRELAIQREQFRKREKERHNELQQSAKIRSSLEMSPMDEENIEFQSSENEFVTKKRQALQLSINSNLRNSESFSDDGTQPESTYSSYHAVDGNIIHKSKVQMSELESSESSSSSDGGGGHFASLGSSTGTFIIQTGRKSFEDQNLSDVADEDENKENEMKHLDLTPGQLNKTAFNKKLSMIQSQEAILFGEKEASYKRKRPATYFDCENSISQTITTSTPESESTSLGKYIAAVNSHSSNATITPTDLDMMAVNKTFTPTPLIETFSVDKNSPIINTDFVGTAVATWHKYSPIPKHFDDLSPLIPTVRRKNLFDSPSPQQYNKKQGSDNNSISDEILSSLPSSIEKTPPEKLVSSAEKEVVTSDGDNLRSTDNENKSFKKKHVRKLSYTLLTPSAELLAASKQGIGPIPLDPLMSAPSSVGIPSTNATPEKPKNEKKTEPPTPTTQELDARLDNLNHAMHKLQQLNLGKGKKAHLERFLGDQRVVEQQQRYPEEGNMDNIERVKQSATDDIDADFRFKKLQKQHEKQLAILAEMHRQQQMKMEQQFALEKAKILQELKSLKSDNVCSTQTSNERGSAAASSSQKIYWPTEDTKGVNSNNQPNRNDEINSLMVFGQGLDLTPTAHKTSSGLQTHVRQDSTSVSSKSHGSGSEDSPPILSTNSQASAFSNMLSNPFSVHQMIPAPVEPMGYVGLSKLQERMQFLSPSFFKSSADARSPLLKGLIFLDPLNKPKGPLKIPPQVNDPSLKLKFEKVTAAVKGYLTRRLLHSEKIQLLIQTIRDTVALVLKLHEEAPEGKCATFMVRPQDSDLHRRLLQQLGGACTSFHNVFFKLSPTERMAIIATDREKLKAKALKNLMSTTDTAHKRNISVATLKCLERRLSLNRSASRKDISVKKIRNSLQPGSQSVKPKAIASYKISPKRRRMSYFDRDQMINNRITKPGRLSAYNVSSDSGRNRWRSSSSTSKKSYNQNAHSSRSDNTLTSRNANYNLNPRSSRSNQETFLIPSKSSRPHTGSSLSTETNINAGQMSAPRSSLKAPWK